MSRTVKILCVILAATIIVLAGMVSIIVFGGSDQTNEKLSNMENMQPVSTDNNGVATTPSDGSETGEFDDNTDVDDSDIVATDPANNVTEPTIDESIELLDGYVAVNEEVRVMGDVHLRSGPGKRYGEVTIVGVNATVTRLGIGADGWSLVETNSGVRGYLASYYVTPTRTPTYEEVSETVYATKDANVRSGPSIQSKQIGTISKNAALLRIGIGDNGWSKIIYNGDECYIYSMYVTDKSPYGELVDNANYKEVNETVVFTSKANMRTGPGSSYPAIAALAKGETVKRIGIGDNGWSIVIYNNSKYYVSSKYLAVTTTPEE